MATRTRQQHIESLSGVGEVWQGEEKISKVSYALDVYQEIDIANTFNHTSEIEGLRSMTGEISVLDGKRHLGDFY